MTIPNRTDEEEFIDAEDPSYFQKGEGFSHKSLVMETMRKCIEAGGHEMRAGWFNEKQDSQGNTIKVYIESTREKFIENVNNAEMVMCCDFDKEAKENLSKIYKRLQEKRQELLKAQWDWFSSLSPAKQNKAIETYGEIIEIAFNRNLYWGNIFADYELKVYRLIFKELSHLTSRLNFYEVGGIKE